ncbi:class I SAM-dependent methyltransferase [Gramella sp. MT6]|uniref:class I SAM-dependent methyltransferase n=1 Tax=Gramella sp. MT6 TaxID=2705471 RepID=UPI001C5E9D2B|nr:class I SAM-dependent methyltransferase [Gramella sp. MT6]QYA26565.1 class I SAM-dependent methyltransferase [Gramella sp. MT6]
MKDNFSTRSKEYSQYRPTYPNEVYDFIKAQLSSYDTAWDCGTGNGQVAVELSKFFKKVEATDISENQLKNAAKRDNIHYSVQPAEKTSFSNRKFDLIISAQAVHWFNFDTFYSEVIRCLKPGGKVMIMGYGLFYSNTETKRVITRFYNDIIGPYWDEERIYLDENYETIPFPFKEIATPEFAQRYHWSIDHLLGYLRTWSAVKHFENENGRDPVSLIESELREAFGKSNEVNFPILLRMGKMDRPA